jgi:26S proteasome regulatory subunit N7
MKVAQLEFQLSCDSDAVSEKASVRDELLGLVEERGMLPYFDSLVERGVLPADDALRARLQSRLEGEISALDKEMKDAKEQEGEAEILAAEMKRAALYIRVGDLENTLKVFDELEVKHISAGQKVDMGMARARAALFHGDWTRAKSELDAANELNDAGGDWDRRNRLRVYSAAYHMAQRDFATAADLLLSNLATFTCTEMFEYRDFVAYGVICAIMSLPRVELKKRVVDSPDVLSVILEVPHLSELLNSFYECRYADFFAALMAIHPALARDRYIGPHVSHLVREYRVRCYKQYLESYRSVTLATMASAFGVSPSFIDRELSRFIAANRLTAKIDKVEGVVETTRPDERNAQYLRVIKQGDALLNRIQKLARILSV